MIFDDSLYFIVIVSILFTSTQAIYTAPVSVDRSSLTSYDIIDFGKKNSQTTSDSNEVTQSDEPEVTDDRPENDEQTMYVIEFESEPSEKDHDNGHKRNGHESGSDNQSPFDPWSIVWYIGSFGGLVAFFLMISCSEWCCRRSARPQTPYNAQRSVDAVNSTRGVTETPPPPYHLFAPPPYDSVNYVDLVDKTSKRSHGASIPTYLWMNLMMFRAKVHVMLCDLINGLNFKSRLLRLSFASMQQSAFQWIQFGIGMFYYYYFLFFLDFGFLESMVLRSNGTLKSNI